MTIINNPDGSRIDTGAIGEGETSAGGTTVEKVPVTGGVDLIVTSTVPSTGGGGGGGTTKKRIREKPGAVVVVDQTSGKLRQPTAAEQSEAQLEQIDPRIATARRFTQVEQRRQDKSKDRLQGILTKGLKDSGVVLPEKSKERLKAILQQGLAQSGVVQQGGQGVPEFLRRVPDPEVEEEEGFGIGGTAAVAGVGRGLQLYFDRRTVKVSKVGQKGEFVITEDIPKFKVRMDKIVTSASLMPELVGGKKSVAIFDPGGIFKNEAIVVTASTTDIKFAGQKVGQIRFETSKEGIRQQRIASELRKSVSSAGIISKTISQSLKLPIPKKIGEFVGGFALSTSQIKQSIKSVGIGATFGVLYQGTKLTAKRVILGKGGGRLLANVNPYARLAEASFFVGTALGGTFVIKKRSKSAAEFGFNIAQPVLGAIGFGVGAGGVSLAEKSYIKSISTVTKSGKISGTVSYGTKQQLLIQQNKIKVSVGKSGVKGTFRARGTSATDLSIPTEPVVITIGAKGKGFEQFAVQKGGIQFGTLSKTIGKVKYTTLTKTVIKTGQTTSKIFKNGKLISQSAFKSKPQFKLSSQTVSRGSVKGIEVLSKPGQAIKLTSQKTVIKRVDVGKGIKLTTTQKGITRGILEGKIKTPEIIRITSVKTNINTGKIIKDIKFQENIIPNLKFKTGKVKVQTGEFSIKGNKVFQNTKGTFLSRQTVTQSVSFKGEFEIKPTKVSQFLKSERGQLFPQRTKQTINIKAARVKINPGTINVADIFIGSSVSSGPKFAFSPLSLRTKDLSISSTSTSQSIRTSTNIKPITIGAARGKSIIIPKTDIKTKTQQRQIQSFKFDTSQTTSQVNLGRQITTPIKPRFIIIPPPKINLGGGGFGGGGYGDRPGAGRATSSFKMAAFSKPSLLGLQFGKGKLIDQKKIFTGFGIRGL